MSKKSDFVFLSKSGADSLYGELSEYVQTEKFYKEGTTTFRHVMAMGARGLEPVKYKNSKPGGHLTDHVVAAPPRETLPELDQRRTFLDPAGEMAV